MESEYNINLGRIDGAAPRDCKHGIGFYLLYSPSYPWQLKNSERDLTEEQLVQLFGRYVRILTDVPIDVDYQSVENGG